MNNYKKQKEKDFMGNHHTSAMSHFCHEDPCIMSTV